MHEPVDLIERVRARQRRCHRAVWVLGLFAMIGALGTVFALVCAALAITGTAVSIATFGDPTNGTSTATAWSIVATVALLLTCALTLAATALRHR